MDRFLAMQVFTRVVDTNSSAWLPTTWGCRAPR